MFENEMIEVASIAKKQTMNDIVNLTIVELALSYKAMQRLIAVCELVRDTTFNYKSWLKWYKQEVNTEITLDKYIKDFDITTIKKEKLHISMIPALQKMFLCIVIYNSKPNHEQLIDDYSNLLAKLELGKLFNGVEITPSIISDYKKKKKIYNDLYLSLKTNHALENEVLDLLTPKRFRDSSEDKDSFEGRNPFESDYFRITTSAPIRRLQDKTQIFPQEKSDFVRRRLTHSIEVSAIGRRLGLMIEKQLLEKGYLLKHGEYVNRYLHSIATILETAGLVHDIGNPPFGHFGEATIQQYFKDLEARFKVEQSLEAIQFTGAHKESKSTNEIATAFSVTKFLLKEQREIGIVAKAFAELEDKKNDFLYFDGNVQGLRILRHLGLSADDNSFNLTMPTMATIIKYPFPAKHDVIEDNHSTKKYGYYQSEKATYEKICKTLHLKEGKRHPLAYLLEAADDIVNVTSDVEDGFKMGIIGIEELKKNINALGDNYLNFDEIEKYIKNQSGNIDCSQKIINELLVKEFRIRAVHKLIDETVSIFVSNFEDIIYDCYSYEDKDANLKVENTLLGNELLNTSILRKTLSDLQKITYKDKYVLKSELLGEHVITAMLDKFIGCMFPSKFEEDKDRVNKLILSPKTTEGKLYALISPNYKHAYSCKEDEVPNEPYQRFQLAVDHVSGMTDSYIVDLYNELTNRKR